ncbi:unnamed protein product [Darwinula stevensoni]|uniref:Peptidase S1 domain-containing protein n=1 Tax=Darwinula stevensoni TaxID=69355 RepID=A0A7R9AJ04_9CRUS|nr:unnamed protein product [Darwinula stevensoni]CAG0907854.1 unnamed protein product [Darwinula stevensoni]
MSSSTIQTLKVAVGDRDFTTTAEVNHVDVPVWRVVYHNQFSGSSLHNDIALLVLPSKIAFNSGVAPVCLPSNTRESYVGQRCIVAGWGSLSEGGSTTTTLREVEVPILDNAACQQKYGGSAPGGIIPGMICAGEPQRDACTGDSGGPLVCCNSGKCDQVGVVSWGIGCGHPKYPGVYTRVSHYMDWITKNLAVTP